MAERITSIDKVGSQDWRFTLSGSAPWTAVRAGVSRVVTESPFIDSSADNSTTEPPATEVFDSTDDPANAQVALHPPYILLQWRGSSHVDAWSVEQYTGGAWVHFATVQERGLGYMHFATPALADQATHQWRVVGYDLAGNAGAPAAVSVFLIRNPDPPSIAVAYAAGNAVVSLT